MKLSLLPRIRRVLSALIASAVLVSSVLSGASFAAAGSAPPTPAATASPPAVAASPPGSGMPGSPSEPVAVAEVVASRTADSSTYQMSDGSRRAEIYAQPIHYKDDGGAWDDIDPTLVPSGLFGQSRAKATELNEAFGSGTATGPPVTVSSDRWSLGMDLLGGQEAGLMALGDTAVYPLAQTATQLSYETRRNGVKDTLVLASPQAPDTFSFFVNLKNLTVYTEPGSGAFALFDSANGRQVGRIEPLSVYDSAQTTDGSRPACKSATMRVVPAPGGAYLTYQVPRAWLDDPARVYPVYVDPAVTFAGADDTRNDTFVAKGDSSYHYSDNHLDASTFATGDVRRALLNFNMGSIPRGSAINSAVLQTYLWQNSSGGNFTILCQPVLGSWGYNATWANSFGNGSVGIGSGGDYRSIPAGANQYVAWDMTNSVQGWFNGSMPNNGLVVYANNESAVCQHSFWSAEYTTWTSRQPHLLVDYTAPSVTTDAIKSAYRVGDRVTLTSHAKSRAVTNLQAKIEGRTASGASALQAWFVFTTTPPGGSWISTPCEGGYISYYPTSAATATPDAGIVPDLSACSAVRRGDGRDVTFVYRIGKGHGDVQSNRLSTQDYDWQNAWQDTGQSYSVLVSSTPAPSATTSASAAWFAETDVDGNGAIDSGCDTDTAGRGSIALSWEPAPAAAGYGVYLFDGNQFERVATTTATSWSTAGKRLYPSDSVISSMAAGFSGNPFATGTLDLRDDPRPLYLKTAGTRWDTTPSYALKVVPFNGAGAASLAQCATVTVALEGRTTHLSDAPRHTEADLGSLYGNSAAVRLDRGDLTLAVTDLQIPGVGPDVSVSRAYRSSSTSSTMLASGWRFAFERSVSASGFVATYLDENRDAHVFAKRGGTWVGGNGETDVLTGDSASGFTLAHKDRTRSNFDGVGRLASEADASGNTVRYEWTADGSALTIRSSKDVPLLHERRITLALSGGRVTQAIAHVAGEPDRVVSYDTQPATLTVVRLPGTNAESTTIYRYDASRRVCAIAVPGFSASANGEAVWGIAYGSAGTSLTVTNDTGGRTPQMPRTVNWDISAGLGSIVTASGTSTVAFDRLGEQVSATLENTSAATYDRYDVDGNQIGEVSPTGRQTRSAFDGRGNEISSVDENGGVSTFAYSGDLCVAETDARGSSTTRSFDAAGNPVVEEKTLNDAGDRSHVEYTYNWDGTKASEKKRIDATRIVETDYSDYSDSGEAQTTTIKNVELAEGVTRDLVSHAWVDGYGAVKSTVDALGVTTSQQALDAAGRELETTDASGTVTHSRYGVLGEIAQSWRSNPATSAIVGWRETEVDGAANVVTETAKASDGAVVSAVAHTYDADGRQVKSDDSQVPGAAIEKYDAQGNVKQSWQEGADAGSNAASQRTSFDAEGKETSSTAPGAVTVSTVTTYTATGDVAKQSEAEGPTTSFQYDDAGDVTTQAEKTDAGTAETDFEIDLDGRTTDVVQVDGTNESVQFDLAGNEIASGLGTQASSTKLVNILGWTLRTNEFDGSITRNTYDELGHVVKSDVNGLATTTEFDRQGRVARQVNPDGSSVACTYDCFGRQIGSVESSGSTVVRAQTARYDAAGRDAALGVSSTAGASSSAGAAYTPDGTTMATRVARSGDASVTTVSDGADVFRRLAARFAAASLDLSVAATDSAGRVLATSSSALPVTRTRAWTQSGQLSRSTLGAALADYAYSATSGRKARETRHLAFAGRDETIEYSYDLAGRLVSASLNGVVTSYAYDPLTGGLLGIRRGQSATSALSYEASGTGRLVSAGARRYRSDSIGRRIAAGTASNPGETTYTWAGERLSGLTGPAGTASYTYDASGQRIRSVVTSAGLSTTTDFDYAEGRLEGLSARRSDSATWSVDYVYDGEGQLFAGVYASSATSATPFLADTTDRGDVRELLDADGAAFAAYTYDAYGACTEAVSAETARVSAATAAAIAQRQPLRYAAYASDAESGLYYCSARYYDPPVAAFISKDPARADGEESPYQYCSGDPVGRKDPSGAMFLSLHNLDEFKRARTKLVAAAKQLVKWKVRYSHGPHVQQPKKNGQMDCSGAVAWIFRRAGTWFKKHIPDPTGGSRWNTDSFVDHLSWRTRHWSVKNFYSGHRWQIGDVLVKGWSGGKMGHIVMVVRDGGNPKLFECAGSALGKYREGARFIPIATRLSTWHPEWAGRFFDYEPRAPYGGRI